MNYIKLNQDTFEYFLLLTFKWHRKHKEIANKMVIIEACLAMIRTLER